MKHTISKETLLWLSNWGEGMHKLREGKTPFPPDKVIKDLSRFRPKEPVTLYHGVRKLVDMSMIPDSVVKQAQELFGGETMFDASVKELKEVIVWNLESFKKGAET